MGLYELFFAETSEAESLRAIAKAHERNSRLRERAMLEARQQDRQVEPALRDLEHDVGTLALILAAILKKLDESGQVTREDLKETLKELDLLDGVRDGKIAVEQLRDGSFLNRG